MSENEVQPSRRGRPPKQRPSEDWNGDTLSITEQVRLSHCQIPFQALVSGSWVLREGCDPDDLINAALNGRENTIANLQLLRRHLKDSFYRGGVSFAGDPLLVEVERRLRAEGLIPEAPPPRTLQNVLRGRV